jgi:hypothetical protein
MDLQELNDRIHELAADDPDAKRVAQKVLADLSAADQRDLAALVLPAHVRSVMTEAHRRHPHPPDQPQRGRTPGVFHSVDGKKYPSAKRRDLADWTAITGASLAAPGGRKFFGEFTVEEVIWLAAQRTAQAEALLRQAGRYRTVAQAMEEAGVSQVKDLDPKRLVQIVRAEMTEGMPAL